MWRHKKWICEIMGFVRMFWKKNIQEAFLPKTNIVEEIVSEILAQLCCDDSIQILLNLTWFLMSWTDELTLFTRNRSFLIFNVFNNRVPRVLSYSYGRTWERGCVFKCFKLKYMYQLWWWIQGGAGGPPPLHLVFRPKRGPYFRTKYLVCRTRISLDGGGTWKSWVAFHALGIGHPSWLAAKFLMKLR